LLIYDLRIQYFGNDLKYGRDYILDLKARDVNKYCSTNRELLRSTLKEAVYAAQAANTVKLDIVALYFKALCDDYRTEESITPDMLLDEYQNLAVYFENVTDEKDLANKKTFEDSFVNSGAANCENIEQLYKEKIAANPDDVELIKKAVSLMSRQNCSSDFYFEITEKQYAAEPSSDIALFLAKAFQDRKEYTKALKYLREALAVETDPQLKESLYAQIAIIELSAGNIRAAADAARSLKSLNPSNGYSYFVLGQCYASSVCEDGLGGGSIYWAAYDQMSQAIDRLAGEPTVQAAARKLASSYRAGFPSQETCFFKELQAGQGFTVPCGMASGAKTTVRYR
jgi:tetratricopeptide (TPR) repeat protein